MNKEEIVAELEIDDERFDQLLKNGLPTEPDGSSDHYRVPDTAAIGLGQLDLGSGSQIPPAEVAKVCSADSEQWVVL